MPRVQFERIDAEEYRVWVDGRPAGALHRDEDEEFVSPSSYARNVFYVWDFNDFDEDLDEEDADELERLVQQIRGLNNAKRIVRKFFAVSSV